MKSLLNKKKVALAAQLNEEHEGAVAFEYIIILVIMAVVIFTAWKTLGDVVTAKAIQIGDFIKGNGGKPLGQ